VTNNNFTLKEIKEFSLELKVCFLIEKWCKDDNIKELKDWISFFKNKYAPDTKFLKKTIEYKFGKIITHIYYGAYILYNKYKENYIYISEVIMSNTEGSQ